MRTACCGRRRATLLAREGPTRSFAARASAGDGSGEDVVGFEPKGDDPATRADHDGSSTVEMVIVIPVFMMVLLVALQLCLWVLADEAVQQVASRAAITAAGLGGTVLLGRQAGLADARSVAGPVLVGPELTLTMSDGRGGQVPGAAATRAAGSVPSPASSVTAVASGHVESIVPWWRLTVRAVRTATVQRFREDP